MAVIALDSSIEQRTPPLDRGLIRGRKKGVDNGLEPVNGSPLPLERPHITLAHLLYGKIKRSQRQLIFAGKMIVNAAFF